MSTELIDGQLLELQLLLTCTSCQLLKATLERCKEHLEGLLSSRRYLTSTFVEKSEKVSEPLSLGKIRLSIASLDLSTNVDPAGSAYETLQYTWDQSSKFLKLYLTVADLTADDLDKVTCSFNDRGLDLRIQNVKGKSYKLVEDNLTHRIKSRDSKYRLKNGGLVLFLWKAIPNQYWGDVTKKPCTAFLDHYGRSQLKTFLHEYARIKASEVYQAANSPLESYVRRLMTSQGYYDVTDVASAKAAISSFERSSPKAAMICLGRLKKRSQSSLLLDLVNGLTSYPCVVMMTCPGFILTDELATYSEILDVLLNGSCELTHFSGRISPEDVGRLPATLYKLGVGVACADDAAAVDKMELPKNLQSFGVSVARSVKVEDLGVLPVIKNPYQLFFGDVTDGDVEWVIGCINKMVQKRVFWLHFPNSTLSPTGLMLLRDKLFNDNWLERHNQGKFIMQMTGQLPFDPFSFLLPPPPTPTAPLLGLHPALIPHIGVVNGALGVAVNTPCWTEHARTYVQEQYRSFGCQLKWNVGWNWNDAE